MYHKFQTGVSLSSTFRLTKSLHLKKLSFQINEEYHESQRNEKSLLQTKNTNKIEWETWWRPSLSLVEVITIARRSHHYRWEKSSLSLGVRLPASGVLQQLSVDLICRQLHVAHYAASYKAVLHAQLQQRHHINLG